MWPFVSHWNFPQTSQNIAVVRVYKCVHSYLVWPKFLCFVAENVMIILSKKKKTQFYLQYFDSMTHWNLSSHHFAYYTVNISAVKITVFRCVPFPATLSLYFLHCTTAPITVEKCKHWFTVVYCNIYTSTL